MKSFRDLLAALSPDSVSVVPGEGSPYASGLGYVAWKLFWALHHAGVDKPSEVVPIVREIVDRVEGKSAAQQQLEDYPWAKPWDKWPTERLDTEEDCYQFHRYMCQMFPGYEPK